jgi:DNA invertase Pin-like site-specific DNA recombinase
MTRLHPLRAAIYARISETGKNRDKVADQILQCKKLAKRRGYEVTATFKDDGISALGSKPRPGFNALLDGILTREFDVVLATEEERFARNVKDKADLQTACIDAGVVWETDRDGYVDPSTEAGEFFSTMRAAMGRMESRRKAARQRAANADRNAVGKPNPGRRRYGYETDGIRPRESEAVFVRRLFAHVAEGGSLRSAVKWLKAEGVDPAPGKEWSSRRVKDLLMNPHYSGHVRHLGSIVASDVVVPIVDAELAAEVVAILSDPSRKTTTGPKPKHLLSGLAHCTECGHAMTYMRSYICKPHPGHVSIQKKILEPLVRNEIAKAFISGGPSLFPTSPNGSNISVLIEAHEKNMAIVAATIADRDEGLVPANMARAHLLKLKGAREAIETELQRARTERGGASALLEIAQRLIVKPSFELREYEAMKETVLARFDELELDKQREIVRALLHIEVRSGRDISRVWIEHKLAVHLNPDADTDSRYYNDADDDVDARYEGADADVDARYYDDADADLDARYNGTDEPGLRTEPPRHPRWTPEGAPMDRPVSAVVRAAQTILREAAEAE